MKKRTTATGMLSICIGALLLLGIGFFANQPPVYAADSYEVTITTYDVTSGAIGGVGTVTFFETANYRTSPRTTGNTITVSVDLDNHVYDGYRLRADNLPSGYRFLGWKRVKNGQTFEEGEYLHPFRQDYHSEPSFYEPQSNNETLYAVYKQVNPDNKVGMQVDVKDEKGNPLSGVHVGLLYEDMFYSINETLDCVSGADGKARTAPDVMTLRTYWTYPELFEYTNPYITPYVIEAPEGYVFPQESVFMKHAKKSDTKASGVPRFLLDEYDNNEYYYGWEYSQYSSSGVLFGARLGQTILEIELRSIPAGGVRINKQDAADPSKALAGAQFDLKLSIEKDSEIYENAQDWVQYSAAENHDETLANIMAVYENDFVTLDGKEYHEGDTVMTITTDSNGVAETGKILPMLTKHGQNVKYSIIEKKAPGGYAIDKEDIASNIELTENEYREFTVTNTKKEEETTTTTTPENTTTTRPETSTERTTANDSKTTVTNTPTTNDQGSKDSEESKKSGKSTGTGDDRMVRTIGIAFAIAFMAIVITIIRRRRTQ